MKTLLIILARTVAVAFRVGVLRASTVEDVLRELQAHEVYSLYTQKSDYLREVSEGLAYNAEVDKAIGIDMQNACEKLTATDSLLICQLSVRNYSGLEVSLFIR